MADDYGAYRRERAAYERAQAREGRVLTPVAAPSLAQLEQTRARDRALALEHFSALAFAARLARSSWMPSAYLLRGIERRGLTWADVEAELVRMQAALDAAR